MNGEEKLLCSELVEVRWRRQVGDTVASTANLEEIWQEGATLDVEQPIPAQSVLVLVRPPVRLNAEVLYCRDNGTGFTVGIRFAAGSQWNPELFVPGHALNPATIKQRSTTDNDTKPGGKAKGAGASARGVFQAGCDVASQVVEQGSLYCLGLYASAK